MRLLIAPLVNLVLLLLTLLGTPFRLLAVRRRPEYVRFLLKDDPPYRKNLSLARRRARKTDGPSRVVAVDELAAQLEVLARAPDLKGVIIKLDELAVGPAKRQAIAQLLERFAASGKEVIGYAVSAGNGEYELLCAAKTIAMPAAGRLELTGYAAEATTVGRGLQRLGVRPEFVRRGDYKTAPELFTHAEVSDIQRQTIEKLLDERYEALVSAIARGRKLEPTEAAAKIDQGPYSARRAQAQGLIDWLASEVDLAERLAPEGRKGEDGAKPKARIGSYRAWASAHVWPPRRWMRWRPRPKISIVPVKGNIVHGEGGSLGGARMATSEGVVKALKAARESRSKAAVLYVESPGGSALASELILEEVRRLAEKKPVIAYFDQVAASGGYMVALGAKEIWSAPHAVVGSIGVFAGKFDVSALLERLGVHRTVISRGKNAGIYSSARGFTPEERAALELDVEETYQDFLGHVAKARGRTKEEIHGRAEGRVYSGRAAKDAGLVDEVSGFEDACRRALALAGKPAPTFDLAVHSTRAGRLSLLRFLQQASRVQLYAALPFHLSGEAFGPGHDFD